MHSLYIALCRLLPLGWNQLHKLVLIPPYSLLPKGL